MRMKIILLLINLTLAILCHASNISSTYFDNLGYTRTLSVMPTKLSNAQPSSDVSSFLMSKVSPLAKLGRLSKNSLTPKNMSQTRIYKIRGFDTIQKFSKMSKNPCWKMNPTPTNPNFSYQCLPYFFLLGVPKSGTTALFSMLTHHPHIIETIKEPHWWTRGESDTDIHQYCLKYTDATKIIHKAVSESKPGSPKVNLIFGDASASTFWQFGRNKHIDTPTVPSQIHGILPHAKLIVSFRNPTERSLSEYSYFIEKISDMSQTAFTDMCLLRISNFKKCTSKVKKENKIQDNQHKDEVIECMYFRYEELYYDEGTNIPNFKLSEGNVRLEVGIYSRPLAYWWSIYGKEQLLVLRSDDLLLKPLTTLKKVFQHLKVKIYEDDIIQEYIDKVNSNNKDNKRSIPRSLKMPPRAKKALDMFYEPFNEELVLMTRNKDFSWT